MGWKRRTLAYQYNKPNKRPQLNLSWLITRLLLAYCRLKWPELHMRDDSLSVKEIKTWIIIVTMINLIKTNLSIETTIVIKRDKRIN